MSLDACYVTEWDNAGVIWRWILTFPLVSLALHARLTHYDVKLTIDPQAQLLRGHESIRFQQKSGPMQWQKQAGLNIRKHRFANGRINVGETSVSTVIDVNDQHTVDLEYTATATKGFRWLTESPGMFTAFDCAAWMVCAGSPEQRATLRLEIVTKNPELTAVGPGTQRGYWRDEEGQHWVFETSAPVQTYLWSFAVARLHQSRLGGFEVFAPAPGRSTALERTAEAARFFREKTGVDAVRNGYRQVFMPTDGVFGQEAAGLALMTRAALRNLENGDVLLMAHELAHQWWGVSVGIRSWSDFWLNEGVAEYVSLLYLEHVDGKPAFQSEIEKLRRQFAELQANGKDRPLHFEGWKDATDALGRLPYVKGALFLHRLRSQVGDARFWQGMAHYSRRFNGKLVDSRDFQRAFEEAAKQDLQPAFNEVVYGR